MLLFSRFLLNRLEVNNNLVKLRFSENILNELISNRIGKPTTKDEIRYYKQRHKLNKLAPLIFNKLKPKVKLIATSINSDQLPNSTLPEVCVYGSHDVGKSTLINAILNKSNLCKTGTRTKDLHFFQVGRPGIVILVDMPGYPDGTESDADVGSKRNLNETRMAEFCLSYLKYRQNLTLAIILIDSKRSLTTEDLELINYCNCNKLKFMVVLNKCDSMKPIELTKKIQIIRSKLTLFKYQLSPIIPISSTKLQNLNQLRQILTDFIGDNVPTFDGKRDETDTLGSLNIMGRVIKSTHQLSSSDKPQPEVGIINKNQMIEYKDVDKMILAQTHNQSGGNQCNPEPNSDSVHNYDYGIKMSQLTNTPQLKLNITNGTDLIKLNIDNLSIISGDTSMDRNIAKNPNKLINCENNLIAEKKELFKSRLSNRITIKYKVSKLKLNTSYKRVFSLYRSKLLNRRTSIAAKTK